MKMNSEQNIITFNLNGTISMSTKSDDETTDAGESGRWKVVEAGVVLFYESSRGIPDEKNGDEAS